MALDKVAEFEPDFRPDKLLAIYAPLNPESLHHVFKPWFDGLRKAGLEVPE
jgi:hypothetical protein